MKDLFPALDYFSQLAKSNRLATEHDFHPCLCSGPDSIQGVMDSFRKYKNFIMVDDTTSQQTFSNGVGYFRRDVYTVFIVAHYRYDDMAEREQKLNLCRQLFRQFHSRLLHDRDGLGDERLTYLQLNNIYSTEFGRYAMNGVTGLYFMVQNEQPIDISYEQSDWT